LAAVKKAKAPCSAKPAPRAKAGVRAAAKLILLGPPGAGKGTQAEALVREFGVPHISTGDILRAAVKAGTPVGRKAKAYMDRGELVPDSIVVEIVSERLRQPDCSRGWLLDGFPRSLAQAEALEGSVEGAGDGARVVYLRVNPEAVVERLSGRRLCRNCGAGYHVRFMPPSKEGRCDKCGGELYQRDDDKPATIRTRLETYGRQTAELIERYRSRGILLEIAGDGEVQGVREAVLGAVRRSLSGG